MRKMKFTDKKGETFIESLVAMLVIVGTMLMLTTAIVTAAGINARARSKPLNVEGIAVPVEADIVMTYGEDVVFPIWSGNGYNVELRSNDYPGSLKINKSLSGYKVGELYYYVVNPTAAGGEETSNAG